LFQIAESGELPFDDQAYRSIETLLCGLLRFGHRLTFLSFFLSSREQSLARKDKDYIDYAKQIELKVMRTPAPVQKKLASILAETHKAVLIYVSVSSLLFMIAAALFAFLRAVNLTKNAGNRAISSVVESEAYRAEYRRRPVPAAA
jgi:hypothetical protein